MSWLTEMIPSIQRHFYASCLFLSFQKRNNGKYVNSMSIFLIVSYFSNCSYAKKDANLTINGEMVGFSIVENLCEHENNL